MRHGFRKYIALWIILILIGSVLFFPFKIQFNFRSSSWIQPLKKWSVRTDLEGNFYSELENFETGAVEQSTSYRFDRGDIATLQLAEGVRNNAYVIQDDTVGWLYSRMMEEKIKQLENLILVHKQLLNSSQTGEKAEIVENLRQKMILAEQQYDFASKNYERSKVLFEDSVITANEYEIAETAFLTAATNIGIAKSEYEIAITGEKPEEIKLIEEQILAYEDEIRFLKETKTSYLLTSPISGKLVFNNYLPEHYEYLSVTDTAGYILYIPVKVQYRPYLYDNMTVEIIVPGSNERLKAKVFDISDKVDNIVANMIVYQVVFVKALIENKSPVIAPGMSVQSVLSGDRVTIKEYIRRSIDIHFR